MHPQAVEVLDADAGMHAVEEVQRVIGMRQLQIVGGEFRGAALDPVKARAVVGGCRYKTLVDEAAAERLLPGLQEGLQWEGPLHEDLQREDLWTKARI